MRRTLSLFVAGSLIFGLAATQPAEAYWRGRHYGHGGAIAGAAIAAGVLGLGAAAIAASQPRYYAPPPVVYAPPPPVVYAAPPPAYYAYPPY